MPRLAGVTSTDRFVNLVEERIDLAIRIGHLEESSLVARRIGEIRLVLCASAEFLQQHGKPELPAELTEWPCIIDSNNPDGVQWKLMAGQEELNIEVNQHLTVNNARAARDLVMRGNGIGYLPSFVVQEQVRDGSLIELLQDYSSATLGIYAMYLHRKHLSLKVRRLMELLTHAFVDEF